MKLKKKKEKKSRRKSPGAVWKVQVVHNLLRESRNLSVRASVRLCVHSGLTPWSHKLRSLQRRFHRIFALSRADPVVLWECLDRRRGALAQSKLENCGSFTQVGLTEIPVNCGCPWTIQACFSLTRWVIVGFILLAETFECAACFAHHRLFRYDEAEESGASLGRLQPHWESFTLGCGSFVIHQCLKRKRG